MRRHWWIVAGVVVAMPGMALAACPSDQVLKKLGTIADADAGTTEQIVNGPVAIDAINYQSTGSASSFALYDGDVASDEVEDGDIKHERGAAASEGQFEEFTAPVEFTDGVTVWGRNLAGVTVFRCEPRT